MPTTVAWFRRDLRLHDHPALSHALASSTTVAPLFVVDEALLNGRWPAPNRLWFMAGSVAALAASIEARGGRLAVGRGRPEEVVVAFARAVGADRIVVSRDLTPYGRHRDEQVARAAAAAGIAFDAGRGLLIAEPEQVRTGQGGPFRVFSPFQRTWASVPRRAVLPAPDRLPTIPLPDGYG
jgi:deoxyribodipyrimidine photo-lyase